MSDDNFAELTCLKIDDSRTFGREYYDPMNNFDASKCRGTLHLSVLGPEGEAVAVSSTISHYFGSKVVGTRTGIVFNDQMRRFSLPTTVNKYGRPPAEYNIIEPLKRPLTSMCPSIVVNKAGQVQLVIGASGTNRIPTAIDLVSSNNGNTLVPLGIKKAIDYPKIHHQLFPSQELIDGLKSIGHEVTNNKALSVVQGILRTGNNITAYSDPWKEGKANGF